MLPSTQSLTPHQIPSLLPKSHYHCKPISLTTSLSSSTKTTHRFFNSGPFKRSPLQKSSFHTLKCSVSVVSEPPKNDLHKKPSPAEVSRTIMELSSVGTLSTLTQEGWPVGSGVRFAVDPEGTPILCLNAASRRFLVDARSSLHVQFLQCGSRTIQCMLQGSVDKPEDRKILEKLHSIWRKRFGEEVDEDLIYIVSAEKVLQIEDLKEEGVWVTSSEYKNASPDPLREFAENIANDINANHMEDFERICNIFVDPEFGVKTAKLIWVDRLGFDVHLHSPGKNIFEARIPFPREVADEKGVKSSFNCMSQIAWEAERNYSHPEFQKGKILKQVR